MSCSVIVSTRNRPALLRDGLAALLPTLRPDDELILVDSASSTDETAQVAAEFGLTTVRSEIKGLSIARNLGVQHATKDIVVFTDDDCRPEPGWLDTIEEGFDGPEVGFVLGQVRADVEDAHLRFDAVPRPKRTFVGPTDPIELGNGACMAFRREAYVGCGGADDRLGAGTKLLSAEDHDLFLRLLINGWTGTYDPDALVLHRDWRTHREVVRYCWGVGLGSGAMVGKVTRLAGLKTTRPLIKRRLGSDGFFEMMRGVRKLDKSAAAAGFLKFTGTIAGLAVGLTARLEGQNFKSR